MKTAISVPDEIYERAERVAKQHGLNRSQFYSTAAARYADELESAELTAAIDAVVDAVNDDESARLAADTGRHMLGETDQQW